MPEQVSVVGFDDMPIARDVTPPLTTVRLPLVEMGVRAMTLALGDRASTRHRWWSTSTPRSSHAAAPHPPADAGTVRVQGDRP